MNIHYINNSILEGTEIIQAILYYKKRSFVTMRLAKDWEGVPTFGQHGVTCGPDSIQSILMYADGFYEIFNRGIYQEKIKPIINRRFNYKSILQNPYTRKELELEKNKVLDVLDVLDISSEAIDIFEDGKIIQTITKDEVQKATLFLAYMFIRFYSIESQKKFVGGNHRSKAYLTNKQ